MSKTYCYSFNEEDFMGDCASIEEAIEESKGEYQYIDEEQDYVFVGENVPFEPYVDGDSVIERLIDQADDAIGDNSGNYLTNVSEQLEEILSDRLTAVFKEWSKEFKQEPNFFGVENVKRYSYGDYPDEW